MRTIEKLADDPAARESMGRAGRELAERDFSWHAIVDRWLAEIGDAPEGAGAGDAYAEGARTT